MQTLISVIKESRCYSLAQIVLYILFVCIVCIFYVTVQGVTGEWGLQVFRWDDLALFPQIYGSCDASNPINFVPPLNGYYFTS